MLKKKNYQPRILYTAKLACKGEGEIKDFSNKQTSREFVERHLQKMSKRSFPVRRKLIYFRHSEIHKKR